MRACAAEAADQAVRPQASQQPPAAPEAQEEAVGALPDSPLGRGQQDQDAGLHPLEAGQGAHHEEQDAEAAVGEEEPGALPRPMSRNLETAGPSSGTG